jgi:hypothetical protein
VTTDLVSRIRARASNPDTIHDMAQGLSPAPRVFPPATQEQIAAAEQSLGFDLPALYKRILAEVGNGGFGPGYGLLGVQGGYPGFSEGSLSDFYAHCRRQGPEGDGAAWPSLVLPVCTWGCGIYSCLDCGEPGAPVLVYDPGVHVLDEGIIEATLTDTESNVVWTYQADEQEHEDTPTPAPAVQLLRHKGSFAEWITAWADGVDLWADMENTL